MSYYKGLWQKTLVWLLIIGIFLTIAGGMNPDNTIWKMWFILPFSTFFIYICGKYFRLFCKINYLTHILFFYHKNRCDVQRRCLFHL